MLPADQEKPWDGIKMSAVTINALLVTVILLECAGAHRHSERDISFDKVPVVAQKYPSLADMDIEPSFLAAHRRKLEPDNQDVSQCKKHCAQNKGIPLSCDDLVCI